MTSGFDLLVLIALWFTSGFLTGLLVSCIIVTVVFKPRGVLQTSHDKLQEGCHEFTDVT